MGRIVGRVVKPKEEKKTAPKAETKPKKAAKKSKK